MPLLNFAHLIALGLWGGCVLVEVLMELMARKNASFRAIIPEWHYKVDLYLEGPLLVLVLLTGFLLFDPAKISALYLIKLALGLIAAGANLVCVVFVVMRKKASDIQNAEAVEKYTRLVFSTVAVGVPAGAGALCLGMSLMGYF